MLDRVSSPDSQTSSAIESRSFGPSTLIESLEGIVYFLIRNLFAIAASIAVAVLFALLYVTTATPIFTAHTQLLLDPRLPQVIRELSEARTLLDRSEIDNQIALMRSEQIARTALTSSKQQARAGPGGDAASALKAAEKVELANVTDEAKMYQAIRHFQDSLTVSRLGVSYVLEIAYSSPDPEMASRMANAAADAYIEDQLAARALAARQGSQWLEERIEELRQLMNSSALRLQEFKARRDYRIVGKTDRSGGPAGNKTGCRCRQGPAADHARRARVDRGHISQDLRELPAGPHRIRSAPVLSDRQRSDHYPGYRALVAKPPEAHAPDASVHRHWRDGGNWYRLRTRRAAALAQAAASFA